MKFGNKQSSRKLLIADFIAGLSVAFILLPEAVAYAGIAHLPIQAAITGAIVGLFSYGCVGGSPFAVVAPTSSAAALLAAVVLSLRPDNSHLAAGFGAALVILTGIGLMIFAKAGLGRLSAFVSRPVLRGFSFALAITIIIKQLPLLVGLSVHGSAPLPLLIEVAAHTHDWSIWSATFGFSALLILAILKYWPFVPGAFLVLMTGIILSNRLDLGDLQVATVGVVSIKMPELNMPGIALEQWLQLAEMAFGLMIIIVAESWGSIRSLSLKHGEAVEPNRELSALGIANLFSGLLQGMPVGAGFSASSASESAGAQTKLAGICAAMVLLVMATLGQHWIGDIPETLVAAAVINALSHALNPMALIRLWRMDRDQYLAIAAVAAVLAFGVLHGMLIAIGLSLAAAIRSFSQPLVRELAELDDTRDYVDRQNHPNSKIRPNILILRPEEPLFFASVEGVLSESLKRLQARDDVRILIISLEETANLDSTTLECLAEFVDQLKHRQTILLLARVKDPISQLLMNSSADNFQDKLFWSVNDAVIAAEILGATN
ncbi:SulP family inorganic anion transporter [Methylomonas albis]|uniref:SulP family inorganic anion transporter n=1 Tax=Methylomonas albis TaxID=1854563 RepID=A0ABR9CZH3_9GAMM|nr:SulP family inorganic anion transporter [Methylomonas albis]MBD9356283.1 SulP family inorganic anion transporter [Methylomonas albis]